MAFPEVGDGELPCWGGTQRLTRAGGVALALQMLVVGDPVDADALVRSGLAALDDDPGARADALAEQLARGAPRAQAAARDAVQRGRDLTLADALRLESDLNLLIATTHDRAEGIAAFFEKRPPRFTGR
jgi:enoyl-CoA hydratase/carnithine racemase